MSLQALHGPHQAVLTVRRELGLHRCSSSDCRFEVLRATVWSLATPSHRAHVNRVLSAALPTWRLLSNRAAANDESLRGELRGALSMLADAGDLIESSGGYWAPATARLVELPGAGGHLLVGGIPSSLLNIDSGALDYHGPHRHFGDLPSELAATLSVEDLMSWARLPETSLQDWAREVAESLERRPYSTANPGQFEFYLPAISKPGAPQFFRWFEDARDMTGTVLARRRRLYGAREYRLVDVRSGRIVSVCEVHEIDVRRLMYAHDLAAKNPVRARALRAGTQVEWLLTNELPRGEQRAFAAFGTLTVPDDRRFERRWKFVRNEAVALEMLRSLGIALVQPSHKDRG